MHLCGNSIQVYSASSFILFLKIQFFILLSETSNVVITNHNTEGSPQIQTLPSGQGELMGALCEKGKQKLTSKYFLLMDKLIYI